MTEMTLDIKTDASNVEWMLERVNTALHPVALVEFLTGEVVPFLNERGKARFASEGDDISGTWQPLAPATQNIRAFGAAQGLWNIAPDHPINVRSHELENYITGTIGYTVPGTEGAILTFPDPHAITPELEAKMETAQRGRSNPRTPPRPVLGVNERDMTWVLERLAMHVLGASDVTEAAVVSTL